MPLQPIGDAVTSCNPAADFGMDFGFSAVTDWYELRTLTQDELFAAYKKQIM